MGGSKEEEKVRSPMFPRLHVNDADKGGPRAPPRNKMALYEHLSVTSQKYSSVPIDKSGSLIIPSRSLSYGGGFESSMLTPFSNSSAPSHSNSSGGAKSNSMPRSHEQNFMKPTKIPSLNVTAPLQSNAKCHSIKLQNFSIFRNSSKNSRDPDDFRVQTFANSDVTPHCCNTQHDTTREKFPRLSASSSIWSSSDKNLVDSTESLKLAHSTIRQEKRNSFMNLFNRLHSTNAELCNDIAVNSVKSINVLKVVSESCPDDKHDAVSNTAMVYCISAVDITPDDVVGIIGEKQFWKARKAIVNQQRLFAVQIFELHRLIKVQKLIAGSPHLLHEDFSTSNSVGLSPVKTSPSRKPVTSIDTHPYSINQPPPCYFHPPHGNQWLVPVMSPSEGLIYKPFTVPYPPMTSFAMPFYSSYGPMTGHQDSYNATQISHATSHCFEKFHMSKESDMQGSSASSASEKTSGNALTLSTSFASDQKSEQQARVIKVVPHNPRTATESAAHIFRTIQEERRQLD